MPERGPATTLTREAAEFLEVPEVRVDADQKTTGRARYTGDVHLPGMLWARYLMSPHPHARIVSIDLSAARAVPGVHAVITADDIGRRRFGRLYPDWPVLAFDKVRYVGERIAVVAAETPEAAEQAVRRIHVEYEELPAVFDAEDAVRDGAPILHPDPEQYVPPDKLPKFRHLNAPSYALVQRGEEEIERIFTNAYVVVEDAFFGPRQHQGYIEPHGCIVWIDADGVLQVISTNKSPFSLRDNLADISGMPSDRIVVDNHFIGGDFGGKALSIDEFSCSFLAKATGRPIRSVMHYNDELASTNPQHDVKHYLRTALNREGQIIAHEARAFHNNGAYVAGRPNPTGTGRGGIGCLSVYRVPNVRYEGWGVYTNLVPSGAMRAPGDFHRAHAGEVHMDHLAREIGMDPLAFRLRNCLRPGDVAISGEKIRNPRAVEVLETLRDETNWGNTPRQPNRGRGIALRHRHVGAGKTELLLRLLPDGTVEAITGNADQGGGSHTVIQRAAAATLSVDPSRVRVRFGSTAEARRDPGSGGSRTTTMVGHAAIEGAQILKDRLESLAAEVMGWPAGEVRLERDEFVVGDGSIGRAPYQEVAARIAAGPVVEAVGAYDPAEHHSEDGHDYNFFAYMIEVEVDPDTGRVRPTEAVAVVDVGTIINPIAHQGQLDGGFVFGIGQALTEELVHEEGRIVNASLGDYKLPTQMDVPPFRSVLLEPAEGPGPFGAKSAGETTNTAVGGAIANAIYDAVGVQIDACPITAERVFAALQERDAEASTKR
jgi:carbon-monoxide dehydrogenase large subunit